MRCEISHDKIRKTSDSLSSLCLILSFHLCLQSLALSLLFLRVSHCTLVIVSLQEKHTYTNKLRIYEMQRRKERERERIEQESEREREKEGERERDRERKRKKTGKIPGYRARQ